MILTKPQPNNNSHSKTYIDLDVSSLTTIDEVDVIQGYVLYRWFLLIENSTDATVKHSMEITALFDGSSQVDYTINNVLETNGGITGMEVSVVHQNSAVCLVLSASINTNIKLNFQGLVY